MSERAFPFIRMNEREGKPRAGGITEIRGPYYSPMGKHYRQLDPSPEGAGLASGLHRNSA